LEHQALTLAKACPIEQVNPDHCPLCDLRLLAPRDRKAWVQALTMEELEYLMLYHHGCASMKTQGTIRPRQIWASA
jgi:hypothetical protein